MKHSDSQKLVASGLKLTVTRDADGSLNCWFGKIFIGKLSDLIRAGVKFEEVFHV